jgi:hypothetical protein
MEYCFVEFSPNNQDSIFRVNELFGLIKSAKESTDTPDEVCLAKQFLDEERAYFWNPSDEEQKEWNDFWFSTPISIRHSTQMAIPPWDFESMLDAFWSGDYDLIGIRQIENKYFLLFNPHGYPYGGVDCMVAFLECLGCVVLSIDDWSQESYVPSKKTNVWQSKKYK